MQLNSRDCCLPGATFPASSKNQRLCLADGIYGLDHLIIAPKRECMRRSAKDCFYGASEYVQLEKCDFSYFIVRETLGRACDISTPEKYLSPREAQRARNPPSRSMLIFSLPHNDGCSIVIPHWQLLFTISSQSAITRKSNGSYFSLRKYPISFYHLRTAYRKIGKKY